MLHALRMSDACVLGKESSLYLHTVCLVIHPRDYAGVMQHISTCNVYVRDFSSRQNKNKIFV